MSDHLLVADNLTVSRGGHQVLDSVSFTVDRGNVFALLGGNGAGKSTTLLTLLGLVTPTSGEARINGKRVLDNLEEIRGMTAYLPESANLYPHLTARENLSYFLALAGVARSASDIELALDKVALASEARDRRLAAYSKGMRQKVAIALAILRDTPLLLLDEPTSGLDPVAVDEFNALITAMSDEGTTVVMVTHDVYGVCHVARSVGLLRHGKLVTVFDAPEGAKFDPESLHEAFANRGDP
ncbi:MAG: ABC transporter ATP-binding protein [Woeseiaceae bacterium]|nr:ABC transporter ATP-binding protein [Woeseiaceae bacterium]